MADNDNSAGAIFLELGLDLNQLESDFIMADQTIQQNLNRLNRERNLIQLRAEVEIGNLDAVADAERILEIRQRALNQQLQLQRDRIQLTEAAWRDLSNTRGADAAETQRMEARLERERLALQRLEEQLRALNEGSADSGAGSGLGGLENIGETLSGIWERIPPQVKLATAGVLAFGGAVGQAYEQSRALIERWRELQTQAYELNMSVGDTENFLRRMRLAGGDIGDFEGYIRGITDAYVKGEWDDPEFIALDRYGAKITDATGKLKDFQAITEEVYQAWKRADAGGNGIEFLQLTGGEAGVRDALQYMRRYEEAQEDLAKMTTAGLDPEELHAADRALNLLTEQTQEFKNAAANAVTPAMIGLMEDLFGAVRDGTEYIAESTQTLQRWGFILAEVLDTIGRSSDVEFAPNEDFQKAIDEVNYSPLDELKDKISEAFSSSDLVKRAEARQREYNEAIEEGARSWKEFAEETEKLDKEPLSQYQAKRIKEFKDELENLEIAIDFKDSEYERGIAEIDAWLQRELKDKLYVSKEEEAAIYALYAGKVEQIEREKEDRLEEIRKSVSAEMQTELERRLARIEEEKEEWINAGMEEAEATELSQGRIARAYEEAERRLADIRRSANAEFQTELENRIDRIYEEADTWIEAGMTAEEAATLAERRKTAEIEKLNAEVAATLDSIWNTELENRLARIEREKQAWIKKGVEEVKSTQWAEQAKVDAQRDAAMSVLKNQLEEYRAYQEGGYRGLREYQLNQLLESGISLKDLQMTPQMLAEFQRAQQVAQNSLLPNFRSVQDRIAENQQWDKYFGDIRRENLLILQGMQVDGKPVMPESVGMAPMDEMTRKFSELNAVMSDMGTSRGGAEQAGSQERTSERVPVQVSVNVQIDEAHAWDTEHIQELADRVAGEIEPAIVGAVGGDINAY